LNTALQREGKEKMPFDLEKAREVLLQEAEAAAEFDIDNKWLGYIVEISEMCERAGVRTHIAFLGNAILAKATDASIDVFSVKLTSQKGSYSARRLADEVLAPMAPGLGIHIGVTGPNPLNNQPYFRIERLGDGTRMRPKSKEVFDRMLQLLAELAALSQAQVLEALRAYIYVRRKYQPKYAPLPGDYALSPSALARLIGLFVSERSDGGRRAQAIVAGLLDVFAGQERVVAGSRVNDPSRNRPGDVAVLSEDQEGWEKAFEVRDKLVIAEDVQIFGNRCAEKQVRDVAVVAIAGNQLALDETTLKAWAHDIGIGLRIFSSWQDLLDEVAFWSQHPATRFTSLAIPRIYDRLVDIEAPADSLASWLELLAPHAVPT
jgi:hypothetical protein